MRQMSTFQFISKNESQTQKLAAKLARHLRQGDCLALVGDFGSGKTTFVKGLACGLGIKKNQYVASPSFVILKIYKGRFPVYHFDLYRLSRLRDFEDIGLSEFSGGEGISIVEWADRSEDFGIPWAMRIEFSVTGPNERRLKFSILSKRLKNIFKK